MRTRWHVTLAVALLPFLITQGVEAQEVSLDVKEHTLKNGMKLLVVPRRASFTFSAYLRFRVGSAHEQAGKTGLSHMLEHMMFKGTRLIGGVETAAEEPVLEKLDELHQALSKLRESERSPLLPNDPGRRMTLRSEERRVGKEGRSRW